MKKLLLLASLVFALATNAQSVYRITATDSSAIIINSPGTPTSKGIKDPIITYIIENTSGGVMGAITYPSDFTFSDGVQPLVPLDTKRFFISFWGNTVNDVWYERTRSSQGQVVGPASATDLELAIFNGTTGKLLKSTSGYFVIQSLTNLSVKGTVKMDSAVITNGFSSTVLADSLVITNATTLRSTVTASALTVTNALIAPNIQVAEGANLRMGVATLSSGTIVVNNTTIGATTRIFITAQNTSANAGAIWISARSNGSSFTILSSNNMDDRIVAWLLLTPAP